ADGRGQGDAGDVVRTEGLDREGGDHGRVEAAGEGDEGAAKTALVGVVAQAEHEGPADVLQLAVGRAGGGRNGRQGGGLCIHDLDILGEGAQAGVDAAGGVGGEAASVEDELVVAADGVAIDDGDAEGE